MGKNKSTRKKIISYFAILIIIFLVLFLNKLLFNESCIFKAILGIPCPGCGITHATLALLHGNLDEALYFHPLVIFIYIYIILFIIRLVVDNKKYSNYFNVLSIIFLAVVIVTYIIRMILFFPNVAPMNYNYDSLLWKVVSLIRKVLNYFFKIGCFII